MPGQPQFEPSPEDFCQETLAEQGLRQTSPARYLHFPPRPPPTGASFLHLPEDVRYRIYAMAGLVRPTCPIDFNREGQDRTEYTDGEARQVRPGYCHYPTVPHPGASESWDEDDIDCFCPPLPIALLLVSRVVSKECARVLYSENKFKICRSSYQGFLPLLRLSHTNLASISSLTIRLNRCACRSPEDAGVISGTFESHSYCKGGTAYGDAIPLAGVSRNDKAILSDWRSVCVQLAASTRPSQLRLFVVCDTANFEVAEEVVRPLSALPTLPSCAIRLGQEPDYRLQSLAETTVRQLTGQELPKAVAGREIPKLPSEIIIRILYFTDLLAPWRLIWEKTRGFKPFPCNGRCNDGGESCCCSAHHAAFSTLGGCWRLPIELFLVNRVLRLEAERLFFGKNHFILLPPESHAGFYRVVRNGPPSLKAFLSAIPTRCVRYLRSLELLFPEVNEGFFNSGIANKESSVSNWGSGLQQLVQQGSMLSKLSLSLNFSSERVHAAETAGISITLMTEYNSQMQVVYRRILEKMVESVSQPNTQSPTGRNERPLKNLFVYLSWPPPLDALWTRSRHQHEKLLERLVMGDGYDATREGKPAISRWGGKTIHAWR